MTDSGEQRTWRLRPGIMTEKWIRAGMFLLGISLGAMGFLRQTGGGSWAFKKGYYGCGWVKAYKIEAWWERTPVDQWYPSYTVVLDRVCKSETGEQLPPDETVWYNGRDVKKGDEISVSVGRIVAEDPPPGTTRPAGIPPAAAAAQAAPRATQPFEGT